MPESTNLAFLEPELVGLTMATASTANMKEYTQELLIELPSEFSFSIFLCHLLTRHVFHRVQMELRRRLHWSPQ